MNSFTKSLTFACFLQGASASGRVGVARATSFSPTSLLNNSTSEANGNVQPTVDASFENAASEVSLQQPPAQTEPMDQITQEFFDILKNDTHFFVDGEEQEWQTMKKLGEGGFGYVYTVTNQREQEYALKVAARCDQVEALKHEYEIYQRLKEAERASQFTLKCYGYESYGYEHCEDEDYSFLLMEKFDGRSFKDVVSSDLDFDAKFAAVGKAVRCLEFMHEQKMVHRDVKPDNFLINNQGTVKIIDFGLTALKFGEVYEFGFCGSLDYCSLFAKENHSELYPRDDLQSLSFVLIQLINGDPTTGPWGDDIFGENFDVMCGFQTPPMADYHGKRLEMLTGQRSCNFTKVKTMGKIFSNMPLVVRNECHQFFLRTHQIVPRRKPNYDLLCQALAGNDSDYEMVRMLRRTKAFTLRGGKRKIMQCADGTNLKVHKNLTFHNGAKIQKACLQGSNTYAEAHDLSSWDNLVLWLGQQGVEVTSTKDGEAIVLPDDRHLLLWT